MVKSKNIIPTNKVLLFGNIGTTVSKSREKSFFDFEFITWMAWTWQATSCLFYIYCTMYNREWIMWRKKSFLEEVLRGCSPSLNTARVMIDCSYPFKQCIYSLRLVRFNWSIFVDSNNYFCCFCCSSL